MKRKIVYSFLAVIIAVTVTGYAAYYRAVNPEPQYAAPGEYEEILEMLIVKLREQYPDRQFDIDTAQGDYALMFNSITRTKIFELRAAELEAD
jgi:hypothetical protein